MSDPSTKSKPKQITTPEGITIIHNAQNQSRKRPQQSQPQAQQQPKQKQQQQPSFGNDIPVYDEELTKELRNTWIRDLDPKNISRDKVSKSLHFIPYGPPLVGTNGDDAYMATTKLGLSRQELLQFQNDDLSTLLRMDFYSFWSQVITDESLSDFLDSYLRHRKRPIDLDDDHDDATNSEAIRKLENDLFRRVFMVFLRLSSHLETTGSEEGDATVFQLPFNNYASMIYDLWIFDIAKLFDICGMYAPSNKDVTSSLVARVFLSQPEYYTNLQEAVPLICNSLDKVITQQQQQARNDSNTKQQQQQQQQEDPQQQSKQQYDDYYDDDEMVSASAGKAKGKGKAVVAPKTAKTATSTQPFAEVAEIAEYLYDVSSTLRSFLETFTYGAFAFQGYQAPSSAPRRQTRGCNQQQHQHEPQHFDQKSTFLKYLVLCFEFVIPHLELYLKSSEDDGAGKNTRITVLLAALQAARENILAIAHVLLDKYYIQRIEQLPVVHNNIEFAKDAYFRTIFNSPTIASDLANLFAQQLQLLEEKSDRPRTGANRDALAKELHDMLTSLPSLATSELSDTAAPRRSKNQHQQPQSQPLEELIQRTSGTFLHEYNMRYRLFDRLQKWKNQKTGLDEASLDFALTILEGLELEMKNRAKQEAAAAAAAPQPQQQQQQQQPTLDGGAAMPAEAALSSQLQAVRDLFPDLGEGYVYECLKYFDFNVESTINNMLENNLPLQLASMDKKKPLEKEQEQKAPFTTTTTTTTTTTRQQLQLPSQASAATSRAEVSQQELQPAVKILPSSNTFVAPQLSSPTDLGGGPAWDKLFTGSLHLGKKKQAIDLPSKAETDAIRAKVLESIMYQDEYDDTFDEYLKFGVGEGDVNEGADDEPLSLSEMNRLRMYPPASVPQKQQQGQQRRPPQQQGQVQQQKPQSRQQQQPANQQQGHQQPRQQQDRGQPRQQQEKQQRSPRQQQQQRQRQRQQQAKDNIVDSEEEEEEDEEEEEEESSEENAERQQQQQQQQRPGGAPAGGASSSGPRNYRRKEANKAKIANHNRKIGAAKKMARSLGGSTSSGVFTK